MRPMDWRAIPGYEGMYEVSDTGRVRSLPRPYRKKTLEIFGAENTAGHEWVWLTKEGVKRKMYKHRAVALAFIGPCPEGMEVRHLDGNPHNNRVENLAYGTRSDNMWDRVAHGNHPNKAKTHCKSGHEFNAENTIIRNELGHRQCRTCRDLANKKRKERKCAA